MVSTPAGSGGHGNEAPGLTREPEVNVVRAADRLLRLPLRGAGLSRGRVVLL
jgi:hypothetical protein